MTDADAPDAAPQSATATSSGAASGSAASINPIDLGRRLEATARNLFEVVRYGGLETGEEPAPFEVVSSSESCKLRRYFPEDVRAGAPPVLLVPPMMITSEIWDVSPRTSAVAALHEAGLDPWVADFGHPDREPGGLERDLADHVHAVSDAVDVVREATGRDVVLSGYSQGGMFAYQTAALRRGKDIDSLVTFGAPVDASAPLPVPLSPAAASKLAGALAESGLFRSVAIPGWFSRFVFQMLTPAKSVQDRIRYYTALYDRDALLPREGQRRFLEGEGWTAWSGPAVAEFLEQFFEHNRMLSGGFLVGDRLVTMADVTVPILTVVGTTDTLGHPDSVRAIRRAAPSAQVYELTLNAGHFGLVVGSNANNFTWPAVTAWANWRAGRGELPENIQPAQQVPPGHGVNNSTLNRLTQVTELGIGAGRFALNLAGKAAGYTRGLVSDAPTQLGRVSRLQGLRPDTRISIGLLLDEQADADAEAVNFLFGDRAYRRGDVKQRIDNVVRGLIDIGVRHGERVGVLMDTRPSAFTVVAALSRLGAVAVIMRPDGDLTRELELGQVHRVISDPDNLERRTEAPGVAWFLLGGGGAARDLPEGVVDMEQIAPERVTLPAWFAPNPQRARDLAFVLFTGDGAATRHIPITNHRWAISALGTASAANLREGDTVYSVTPIHHSSSVLMSVAGAVAGGSRLALARRHDPSTFWDEVRRYGVTHVPYTWTSLMEVTDGPPHPNEPHNPIQMFMGSGMPRSLWRRVADRFPDARVLEFYASAEGNVILANVTGTKQGSVGRPLPGTPEVRVIRYDLDTDEPVLAADGSASECLADEVGLLIARVDPDEHAIEDQLRSVFAPDDAWVSTGDLFLRDQQGDMWCAGPVREVVRTAQGPVIPSAARFCLGRLPGIAVPVVYGVPEPGAGVPDAGAPDTSVLVGVVMMRAGRAISADDLDRVFEHLPRRLRPAYVQVVKKIPITTWGRPLWRPLQAAGIPAPKRGTKVFALGEDGQYAAL